MTECEPDQLIFQPLAGREVVANFDGGHVTSDGGALLLRQIDSSRGIVRRFGQCFRDHRNPELIEHTVEELVRQRVYGIALGYEDLNDHDMLRFDPALAVACDRRDPQGKLRRRKSDQGKALCGKSTLNRLELTTHDASSTSRYKKIVFEAKAIEDFFIDQWVKSLKKDCREVILDFDATDLPVHGTQEGRGYHGFYGHYCYLPLYVFCGDWPIVGWLRESLIDASAGALEVLRKIVEAVRRRFPKLRIIVRADSGFCRDEILSYCEANDVNYLIGLARNKVLERLLARRMRFAEFICEKTGEEVIYYEELKYGAKKWSNRGRRVIGKAQYGLLGANPRFVITNLTEPDGKYLYEQLYCARGRAENVIKEQLLDLKATRVSTHFLRSNQLRLWFSMLAHLLMVELRRIGLKGTNLSQATCGTIRLRLFKIGGIIRFSYRRIVMSISSGSPARELMKQVYKNLLEPAPG